LRARVTIAGLVLLGAAAAASAADTWSLRAVPAWVAPIEAPAPIPAPAEDVASGTYDLLFDHQVRVGEATSDEYFRRVIQVLTTSGVQNASEITLDFDPSSERLVLHSMRILRAGRDVSTFRAGDLSVIRPERESEEGIYSGTLSAVVFLRDVRPGDVLDYAYSLVGTAPSPPPSFAEALDLAYGVPVGRLRHRLLWPAKRRLNVRNQGCADVPAVEEVAGLTVYTWTREAVPALTEEDDLPAWFDPYPAVQLSEFASWAAVARWTAELYEAVDRDSTALDGLIAHWASATTLEARALAAVRFVQDDVRYLGLEIGPGAFQPRPPGQVLAQRFGDCKDKALLLSALLRRMGIDARPALVNSRVGRGLDTRLPSPLAFDHVIVRVKLGRDTRWIDATTAHQGGRLDGIAPPSFERALVVDASAIGLEAIPKPPPKEPTTAVEEDYSAPFDAPATLIVRAVYRGRDADAMRATLADTSAVDLASSYLNHYAHTWPAIEGEGKPVVQDQRDLNRIEIRGTYRIPSFWAGKPLYAWSLSEVLQRPSTVRRSMPLAVAHPTRLSHRVSVRLPLEPDEPPPTVEVKDPAFHFALDSRVSGATLTATLTYESLADAVNRADLPRYLADLDQARARLTLPLARPTGRRAARRRMLATLVAAPALFATWVLLRRRRRSARLEPA